MIAEGRVVKAIRRRITYPRAGFVEFKKPTRGKALRAALSGAITAALLALAIRARVDVDQWLVALIGFGMGGMLSQIGRRSSMARFQTLGLLLAALGCGFAVTNWPFALGLVAFFSSAALALAASGGLTLWRFLHT